MSWRTLCNNPIFSDIDLRENPVYSPQPKKYEETITHFHSTRLLLLLCHFG